MLCADTSRGTIWPTEYDGHVHGAGRHVECFRCRIDDVIDCLHGEIERHEFANGTQTGHSGADSDTSETHFGDWCINHSFVSILFPQTSRHLQ